MLVTGAAAKAACRGLLIGTADTGAEFGPAVDCAGDYRDLAWDVSNCILASMAAVWSEQYTEKLLASAQIARDLGTDMNPAVMLILAFYFAAPHMGEIAKTAIERMKR